MRLRVGLPNARPSKAATSPETVSASRVLATSICSLGALVLGATALVLAAVMGQLGIEVGIHGKPWTIWFSAGGVVVALVGLVFGSQNALSTSRAWLLPGGILSGLVLALALFAPGILNDYWAMNAAVPMPDENKQARVNRFRPQDASTLLAPEEWVEAEKEALRLDDLHLTINSVKIGPLANKGPTPYLQIHFRTAKIGPHRPGVRYESFSTDKHLPVLTDSTGRSYPFVEQRTRKMGVGSIYFEVTPPRVDELNFPRGLDRLLVFEAPSPGFGVLKLQVPASVWGRKGVCKLQFKEESLKDNSWEAPLPDPKK